MDPKQLYIIKSVTREGVAAELNGYIQLIQDMGELPYSFNHFKPDDDRLTDEFINEFIGTTIEAEENAGSEEEAYENTISAIQVLLKKHYPELNKYDDLQEKIEDLTKEETKKIVRAIITNIATGEFGGAFTNDEMTNDEFDLFSVRYSEYIKRFNYDRLLNIICPIVTIEMMSFTFKYTNEDYNRKLEEQKKLEENLNGEDSSRI